MKTAIVYASGFTGHTRNIAKYLASRLEADAFDVKEMGELDWEAYQRIIIGTNVHAGNPNKRILEFVNQNSDKIANRSPILYISCMYKGDKGAEQAKKVARKFGMSTYYCLPSGGEKNNCGMPKGADEIIAKIQ